MNEFRSTSDAFSEEQPTELDGEPPEPSLRVLVADQQSSLRIDSAQIQRAVEGVFRQSHYDSGTVSIAVVDDPTIHEINRQYLDHDYPTDVLSFVFEDRRPYLEGELVVSTDTATANAAEFGWPATSELLLYVLHGALHLVGHRDKEPVDIARMRAAELQHLREFDLVPSREDSRWSDVGPSDRPSCEVPAGE